MKSIRKILVPVDFSECSAAAVDQAAWVADKCQAELELLHVWQAAAFLSPDLGLVGAPPVAMAFSELVEKQARDALAKFQDELAARGIRVARASAEQGEPWRAIVAAARERQADLLVMGTHGRTGLEHTLLGSVVEKVLRRAPCPVLSVRAGAPVAEPRAVRRILVPVDYSENSGQALGTALAFAPLLGANVEVVHVWDRPPWMSDTMTVRVDGSEKALGALIRENAEREMTEFLAKTTLAGAAELQHRLISGDPAGAVLRELESGKYDLVVIGTHGRGGLKHLLLGSVAEKLTRLSAVPVLTVPWTPG